MCVPERLCPHCLLCLSMTEHLSEASCQSAAFNQIVAAKRKWHKKMKAWQKFTAIKQTNYFFDCDLFLLGFCWLFFLQFLLTKSKVKKKKSTLFLEKKNIFFSPIQQWNKRTILEEPQQLTRVIRSLFPQRPPAAGSCCDVLRWMHGGLPKQHCQQTQPVPPWQERPVRWILPGPGSMMHRSCPWCCGSCP